jgi:hypothetical protein
MRVSEKYYSLIFDFFGQWDMPSKCGLRIVDYNDKKVIVVTELYQQNPGTSITCAGYSLKNQICQQYQLDINSAIYIECNPDTNSVLSFYDEEFFQVDFVLEGDKYKPFYTQLSSEKVKELFGDKQKKK